MEVLEQNVNYSQKKRKLGEERGVSLLLRSSREWAAHPIRQTSS